MMKKIFLLIFLLPLIVWAEKFKVDVVFRPAVVTVGEPVEIILIANKRGTLSLNLPKLDGGTWMRNYISNSMQTSSYNGVVSTTVRRTIPVLTEKPGALTIPAFQVTCGKETAMTRELVIKVLSASDKAAAPGPAAPEPVGEISVPSKNKTFYIGEEIPLDLSLLLPDGLEVRELSYPELTGVDGTIRTDYSKVNPENRFFAPPVRRRRVIGNQEYTEILFKTSFRPLKAETITPGAVTAVGIVHRSKSRTQPGMFDDDFFGGFFSGSTARVVSRQIVFKYKGNAIVVRPVPPLTVKSNYLDLVGNWHISVKLGSVTAKVGEPVELTVTLKGSGSGETLSAPQLQLPGFRVYPPEIKKYADRIEIKYALIPLETGEKKVATSFAVFNPVSGRYAVSANELILPVSAGNSAPAAVVASPELPVKNKKTVPKAEPQKAAPVRSELFYQKSTPGKTVYLPLMRNQWIAIVMFFLFGIAGGIALRWISDRKEKALNDEAYRLKKELHHQLKYVLDELKAHDYSPEKVRELAVPHLAQSLGLAPGTTPDELAERISDPELAAWLRALNASGFMPGSSGADALPSTARIRSLLKALKKCSVVLVTFAICSLFAGFNTAFDKGSFDAAEKEYKKFISNDGWSANALYNLGAVYYMKNDLPRARLYFMRALLIAPHDAETLENLNLVNRKLMQQEVGSAASPGELLVWCRDRLRPDQYCLLCAFFVAVLIGLAGLYKRSGNPVWLHWTAGAAAALALLSIAAVSCQMSGPYNRENAVVVAREIKLRSLPVSGSKVEVTLPGGSSARIVESRDGWTRIKINGQDGWVEAENIESVFPEGLW